MVVMFLQLFRCFDVAAAVVVVVVVVVVVLLLLVQWSEADKEILWPKHFITFSYAA